MSFVNTMMVLPNTAMLAHQLLDTQVALMSNVSDHAVFQQL